MAVIEINKNPSARELRVFGLLLAVFAGLIGALLFWKWGQPRAGRIVWIAGAAVVAVYFAIPPVRRLLYLGWMYAAFPIGFVVSHVILAAIFYLVFTPIGLLMRLVGYDPMHRRFDRGATSYWTEHDPHKDPARYFRQF